MMQDFINAMKGLAGHAQALQGVNRWGIVTSTRQSDTGYDVKVQMMPGSILTGWLPVLSHAVGPGWGIVAPPEPGMQAFLGPDYGNGEHNVVLGLAYSLQNMPPVPDSNFGQAAGVPVQSGEMALVSKAGAVIRLCADGSIHIKGPVRIDGNLTVQGNIVAQANGSGAGGDVSDRHGSLDRLRGHYDAHIHGSSPTTSQPDPE
jgi:phage baseplate assembly protein gpV